MSGTPAVSVVMSVYNGGRLLRDTLQSILGQTERDFELVIVDDGSTDETPRILAESVTLDSRVSVVSQANQGLTRALIAGCARARGRYIARHDAGDLSAASRLARQKQLLDTNPGLALVSCWTDYVGPELEPLFEMRGRGTAVPTAVLDPTREHGVTDGPAHHGSVMFRRDLYLQAGGYRAAFHYGQDWDLWYRLLALGTYAAVPEVLYIARVTPESISASARVEQQELAQLSREALRMRMEGRPDDEVVARATTIRPVSGRAFCRKARGLYFIGETLRRNGDPRAVRYLRDATAACPLLLKSWLRLGQALMGRRRIS